MNKPTSEQSDVLTRLGRIQSENEQQPTVANFTPGDPQYEEKPTSFNWVKNPTEEVAEVNGCILIGKHTTSEYY